MKTIVRRRLAPSVYDDPAIQRMKAARRNISHDDAVQESFFLYRQFRKQWIDHMADSPVDLNDILQSLSKKKIPFVLTGAYAIGGWTGRPRSTHDVDILVRGGRNHARAVRAMRELYPRLEVRNLGNLTAFFVAGENESVIDVTTPHRADNVATLETAVWITNPEGIRYRIPALEAALANKYGAMLALGRELKKRSQDAIDFSWMVTHSMDEGQRTIDTEKLAELGELVWPGGVGREILKLVEECKRGGVPDISRRPRNE